MRQQASSSNTSARGGPKTIEVPEAFSFLFEGELGEYRNRICHGGRGSGKSHAYATALVIRASQQPLTVLCCREIQKSIRDSAKRLIENKIVDCGLSHLYHITETEIRGPRGTRFMFAGLRSHPESVQSAEAIDVAWVEEARRVSARSWEILKPTIRRPNSEIWVTYNPYDPTDPVDQMFRGPSGAPPRSLVREVNYDQNPFFPDVLREEMEWDRSRDPEKYAHIWLGKYRGKSEARVFHNWKVEEFDTPEDAEFYFGGDWGFANDPTVLVRQFIRGRKLYIDGEAYKVGCEIDETPALFAGSDPQGRWENPHNHPGILGALKWNIRADSARPETISYMQRKGFKIIPALKGAGSVEDGVEFLKTYDIVIHPRCKHTIDEFTFYSYKVDQLTGKVLPVLVDKKNNVIDACRYGTEEVQRARPLQVFF
jgi:phage terminase large subunit